MGIVGTTFGIKFYYKRSGVGVSLFPWIYKVPANHIPLIVEGKHPICVETHTPTSAASSNEWHSLVGPDMQCE